MGWLSAIVDQKKLLWGGAILNDIYLPFSEKKHIHFFVHLIAFTVSKQ